MCLHFWGKIKDRLQNYLNIYKSHDSNNVTHLLEKDIINMFGDISPREGVQVGKKKQTKDKIFLESYRRTYQEFLTAYRQIEELYRRDGRRQQPEEVVPLRIEMDQFFSFIREVHAGGDMWKTAPLLSGKEQERLVKDKLEEWFSRRWKYLDDTIPDHIEMINRYLSSKSSIENANIEQLFRALDVCHSFHHRLRFFLGGHETLKGIFISDNKLERIKEVISYLLHGNEDFITRMGNCIFDEKYSLSQVGRSFVQELLGWVNKEDIPICNGRTVKALRYLGYNVVVFN